MAGRLQGLLIHLIRVGIPDDSAVSHPDNPVGIQIGKLRIVGDHDHKTVFRHLFQKLHDLDTGLGIQSTGRLICQQNTGIVYKGTGHSHTLHLTAGHLTGFLVKLIAQTDFFQRFHSSAAALGFRDAGDGKGQLHVGKHSLMGNQIIALEHKTDGMVPVGIPVPVGVFFCGDSVNNQISAVILIQTADHVQQGGFSGAAGSQNGHQFAFPQVEGDTVQSSLYQFSGYIFFSHIFDLQHRIPSVIR